MDDRDSRVDRARQAVVSIVDEDALRELRDAKPQNRGVRIDWQDLAAWDYGSESPDGADRFSLEDVRGLASDIIARPAETRNAFEQAFETLDGGGIADVDVQIHNLPPSASHTVGEFSPSAQRSRLIELEGQITKRTERHPSLRVAVYRCTGCEQTKRVEQRPYGKIQTPDVPCWECKGERPSSWMLQKDLSEWADHQKLRLQQPPEAALGETKNIDAHIFGDLTGRDDVESGARVTLSGELDEVFTGYVNFDKCVIGHAITPEQQVFDDEDLEAYNDTITQIRDDDDRFAKLVASLAPGHEGDPLIKEALTVQLFTGGKWYGPDGSEHRGDSHVQLIGDPGTNKTGLLKAMFGRAPVGAFSDGPGSSGVGLTAALSKDDFSDEQWSIEAGTMVQADGGTAFVDEIDKFDGDDLSALHTPLESQEVFVAKGGKRATLPAKTSLVSAANPTGGHYKPSKDFIDQVDLQSPLLSRFDLIFVMREKYEEGKIRSVASSMVESRQQAAKHERGELDEVDDAAGAPYTADEMRAYIAAAKRITPVIRSQAVKDEIVDWFATLKTDLPNRYRQAAEVEEETGEYPQTAPPLPVTARKVDAMQRLASASARIRMSETIEMQDIERVRPYLKRSLADIGIAPSDNEAFPTMNPDTDIEEVGV